MKHTVCNHVFTMALRFRGNLLNNDLFNDSVSSKYSVLQNVTGKYSPFFLTNNFSNKVADFIVTF